MTFRVLSCLLMTVLAGCVQTAAPSSGDFVPVVRDATRRYVHDLADAADHVATSARGDPTFDNPKALTAFKVASREARERFNTTVGEALDRRSPPGEVVDPAAWRELAAAFRQAAP